MKKLACMLLGAAFAFTGAANADEKHEQIKDANGKVTKEEHVKKTKNTKTAVKSKSRRKMAGGSVSTTETTRDTPNSKVDVKETTERDAQGNVIRHEIKK